jgi:hypothetical protein
MYLARKVFKADETSLTPRPTLKKEGCSRLKSLPSIYLCFHPLDLVAEDVPVLRLRLGGTLNLNFQRAETEYKEGLRRWAETSLFYFFSLIVYLGFNL